jgi:hypothetical protein
MSGHRALAPCLGMIFSENRFTLFRIMPQAPPWTAIDEIGAAFSAEIVII